MSVLKAKKKPIVIEVLRWTGDNRAELIDFMFPQAPAFCSGPDTVMIPTLEGPMLAGPGSWIARGCEGEFYPIKASIFEKTYEVIQE